VKFKLSPKLRVAAALSVVALLGASVELPLSQACAAEAKVSFSDDILPLLKWRCDSCHQKGGEGFEASGLDLTSYQGLMKGTKYGAMVVPGDPEMSNLMMLLDWRVAPAIRMPHGKKQLSSCDRASIRAWIRQGAKDN
jgi:hypothetical protein